MLLGWRTERKSYARIAGQRLAWLSVCSFLLGMLLGGATLLLPPDEGYWEVLNEIPKTDYWFAAFELSFSLVCLVSYAATWELLAGRRLWHSLIAVVSVTNLLYHFPPLMIVIGQLADRSSRISADSLDRAALVKLMLRSEVVAPWLHFVLASLAVAAAIALWLLASQRKGKNGLTAELVAPSRKVAGCAALATVLQLPIGLWLVTTISQASRAALMGSSAVASITFLAAMMLAFLLLARFIKIALGEFETADMRRAALLTVAVVLLMATSMRFSRYQGPEHQVLSPNEKSQGALLSLAHRNVMEYDKLERGSDAQSSSSSSSSSSPSSSSSSSS